MEKFQDSHVHESDDRLELYALDRLSDTEIMQVEEHLFVCEACRERLEQNAAFAFAVQDVLKQHPELMEEKASGNWFKWLDFSAWKPQFAFGALAAVVLCAGIYWIGSGPGAGSGLSMKLAPVASLQLMAMRGEMQSIPAAKELDLTLTDAPVSGAPFRMEMVDAAGAAQWNGTPQAAATGLTARIAKPLPPGVYFARLYDSTGKLLHEYGFRVVAP